MQSDKMGRGESEEGREPRRLSPWCGHGGLGGCPHAPPRREAAGYTGLRSWQSAIQEAGGVGFDREGASRSTGATHGDHSHSVRTTSPVVEMLLQIDIDWRTRLAGNN